MPKIVQRDAIRVSLHAMFDTIVQEQSAMQVQLSAKEWQTIQHCLYVAAKRFRLDAKLLRQDRCEKLADQFDIQISEALAIFAKIERST